LNKPIFAIYQMYEVHMAHMLKDIEIEIINKENKLNFLYIFVSPVNTL